MWTPFIIGLFGALLVIAGLRTLWTGRAKTDAEFSDAEGSTAIFLGALWLLLGAGLIAAAALGSDYLLASARFLLANE